MLTIGVDAHKGLHVAAAVDEAGRLVGTWRGANTPARWTALRDWACALAGERRWGIEGSGGYGRGLAQALVAAGETVFEVNPRLTAALRRRARRMDKNDRLDAQAVAEAVRREGAHLPAVLAEDATAVAALLTQERDAAVTEATRLRNQLHALLHQADPAYRDTFPDLDKAVGALGRCTARGPSPLEQARAAAIRRLAARLRLVLQQLQGLTRQIEAVATRSYAPLLELVGVGAVQAVALAGILGPAGRFRTDEQLAAYGGVAPLETSSAGAVRHRLNRGGHRRLNAVLYRIVLTQSRVLPEAREYIQRRMQEGKSWREAVRALKRFVARRIFQLWQRCHPLQPTAP
jgi:transposase